MEFFDGGFEVGGDAEGGLFEDLEFVSVEREGVGGVGFEMHERGAEFAGEVEDSGGEAGAVVFFPCDKGVCQEIKDGLLLFVFVVMKTTEAFVAQIEIAEGLFSALPKRLPVAIKCGDDFDDFGALNFPKRSLVLSFVLNF